MKPEALENLLIDRALGQLSPEVEALLSEHLHGNPDAARAAAELSEVVALATAAMRQTKPKLELPPRAIVQPRWPHANRALAMAASFAIGAGATFLAMRETAAPREIPTAQLPPAAPAIAKTTHRSPEVERALKKLPFWSKERAYLIAETATKNESLNR